MERGRVCVRNKESVSVRKGERRVCVSEGRERVVEGRERGDVERDRERVCK